ncbi:MAG: UvrD-helicase domain-containing protein, partial [Streptococcaceae bacterium]|nr:UvrD-helicase domain-containing protein [Streptococcaceae bacterium]
MSDLQLTAEQKQAIFSSGHNILVSASAGSGKTFVMANRIIEKIKSSVDIESLFISTFTKKAATELRQRIEKDLKEAIQSSSNLEERQKLGFALQRLSNADIGTMDSFTQKLLKTHFNLVDVDPNFNILADKTERDLIQEDIFEILVEAYLSEDENIPSDFQISKKEFEKMIKNFSTGRNIKEFKDVVYNIYSFSLSTENPIKWLENQFLEGYSKYKKFSDLPSEFTGQLHEELSKFYEQLDNLLQENALTAKTLEKAQIVYDNKTFLLEALINKDFSQFADLFNSLDWFRWTIKDEAFKKRFNETIGTKASPGLARQFNEQVKHSPIIEEYQPQAVELIKNLQIFSLYFYKVYLDRKRQENTFDYADIAHFAIEILENNPQVADFYRAKYNEIMIDEYQDTSHVQEKMLQLLSKNGDGTDNIFMVGDIKQSIYGFRQADPSLFLKKYQDYQKEDNPHELIRLKENFRSRPEIIQFTNQVFTHLMDTSVGEMTYGKEEELVQGNIKDYPQEPEQDFLPELLLYQSESNGNTDDENLEKVSDGEIRATAKQIQQLIKNGIQPKNIAILVRSKTNNNKIEDILTSYDIPLVLDEGRVEFLKSIEVQV